MFVKPTIEEYHPFCSQVAFGPLQNPRQPLSIEASLASLLRPRSADNMQVTEMASTPPAEELGGTYQPDDFILFRSFPKHLGLLILLSMLSLLYMAFV